jgi:hypothetical protein
MMQGNISAKNYKTYSTLLRSLLDTQESLPGRISPDILEPVTDIHQLRPGNNIGPQDSVEITTGTSIWALYLKRQIQEKNRVDQRQLKSVFLIKFTVLNASARLVYSTFLDLFHWNKRKKIEIGIQVLKEIIRKRFNDLLKNCKKKFKVDLVEEKNRKRGIGFIVNKMENSWRFWIVRCFREWHAFSILSYSYSCISPICPEKEESEAFIKLNETLTVVNEKNDKIVKNALVRFKEIVNQRNRACYLYILIASNQESLLKSCEEMNEYLNKENKLRKMIDSLTAGIRLQLYHRIKSWKYFTSKENYKEKCLKNISKFLHFRLLDVFNLLNQKMFNQKLVSHKLLKLLSNLSLSQLRNSFFDLLKFQEFLLKKGFDMFINNKYKKNLEKINNTWKSKLNYSDSKFLEKNAKNLSNLKSGTFFLNFIKSYSERLLRHSFQTLSNLTKS